MPVSWWSTRCSAALSAVLLVVSIEAVWAVEPKDASYFCVAEASGGLSFNAVQKRWIGTSFRASEKFVLRLKYVDANFGTAKYDKDELYTNFEAFVTPSGSNYESKCAPLSRGGNATIAVGSYGGFACYANIQEYVFNLNTNRYLNLYSSGYTDGTDNNENTPSVTAGVCTKIK